MLVREPTDPIRVPLDPAYDYIQIEDNIHLQNFLQRLCHYIEKTQQRKLPPFLQKQNFKYWRDSELNDVPYTINDFDRMRILKGDNTEMIANILAMIVPNEENDLSQDQIRKRKSKLKAKAISKHYSVKFLNALVTLMMATGEIKDPVELLTISPTFAITILDYYKEQITQMLINKTDVSDYFK